MAFYNLLGFCSKQYAYKALIYSSYMEYKSVYENLKYKYPTYHYYMKSEEIDKLGPEFYKDRREAAKNQAKLVDEIVDLMGVYCKKYPGESICKYPEWKTYKEYPYRVSQALPQFMNEL